MKRYGASEDFTLLFFVMGFLKLMVGLFFAKLFQFAANKFVGFYRNCKTNLFAGSNCCSMTWFYFSFRRLSW